MEVGVRARGGKREEQIRREGKEKKDQNEQWGWEQKDIRKYIEIGKRKKKVGVRRYRRGKGRSNGK